MAGPQVCARKPESQLHTAAAQHIEREGKTMPSGVSLMRSQVLYRAAQVPSTQHSRTPPSGCQSIAYVQHNTANDEAEWFLYDILPHARCCTKCQNMISRQNKGSGWNLVKKESSLSMLSQRTASTPFVRACFETCHAQHAVTVVCELGWVGVEGAPPCFQALRGLGWSTLVACVSRAVP